VNKPRPTRPHRTARRARASPAAVRVPHHAEDDPRLAPSSRSTTLDLPTPSTGAPKSSLPRPWVPTPGSADVCFIVDDDIRELITELTDAGIAIEEGPVERTGATGPIVSCYLRDPDQNLIELSNYTP
jgi:catechol 2,3-dioxygenase-like lactoylglutathione lyase family enzyme